MIPKIIHYCWISGDKFPEKIQMCYDSWKKILPDYEIIVWDYEKVHALNVRWCEEAMACKKYAFVADYIRFYALYNYGGIYLDSDVEVLKSFDNLLKLKYFVGKERDTNGGWEAAIIGAEKGTSWLKLFLRYYRFRSFIDMFGSMKTSELPLIMRNVFEKNNYAIRDCYNESEWVDFPKTICRFPDDWFSPKHWKTGEILVTKNTYSIHHFSASWKSVSQIAPSLSQTQRFMSAIRPLGSKIKHILFPWKYKRLLFVL